MSSQELQEEEREALEAIFEADEYFTKTSGTLRHFRGDLYYFLDHFKLTFNQYRTPKTA